ncbi:uroporphyrinogen decarboxylase [Candidatus Poribacteria bacterium]|nr:uroporphyrinogen decarboxylase [Candidatus Poribacteria bacterium]
MQSTNNNTFIKACRREKTEYTPVWLMRQAGRYMEEYRQIKTKYTFLEMCKNPEIAATVTLQPIKKIPLDAAIIFADILLPLEGMGINFNFGKNDGPVISNPVRTAQDVEKILVIEPEKDVPYLIEAIKIVRRELDGKIPLIGFSGAPFTLASYIIEGGHSKDYALTKIMMYNEPLVWHKLMDKLTSTIIKYLTAQVQAGAQALQLFDSWIGCLSEGDYREFILPYSKKIFVSLKQFNIPTIHFGTGTSHILELLKEAGGDVIGVDWRTDLDKAWARLGNDVAVQGNLDPIVLLCKPEEIIKKAKKILDLANNRPGHIFNLGHGILQQTPVENVITLVNTVHEYSKR